MALQAYFDICPLLPIFRRGARKLNSPSEILGGIIFINANNTMCIKSLSYWKSQLNNTDNPNGHFLMVAQHTEHTVKARTVTMSSRDEEIITFKN